MRDIEYWTDVNGKKWRVPAMGKRMQFSNRGPAALRAHIFRRDKFTCMKCGWSPASIPADFNGRYTIIGDDICGKRRELQLDHIEPISLGGSNHPDNLQTLCFGCNASKRDSHGR